MNSPTQNDHGSSLRVFAYAVALILPPLLAYNRTPSATLLNELVCVFGWGLCLAVETARLPNGVRRHSTAVLVAAMSVLGLCVVGSWTLGSLPTSLALPPLLFMIAACVVAALGARVGQAGPLGGLQAFAPFAIGLVVVGVLSALVAVIQVYVPKLADGVLIAQSGLPGRAVGNLRQPNHLASLLIWAVIALVPLVQWRRIPGWLAVIAGALIMEGVVLSGSRTGLYGGVFVLMVWGALDARLSRGTRIALVATILFPLGVIGWQWATTHLSFVPQAAGAATRLSEGDSSHFKIWRNAVEMVRQQPWLGVGWGEFNFAWTLTPFPDRPIAFFDHTHDLPLQFVVELGFPIALLVLGLLVWAMVQGFVRAWSVAGEQGHGARAAWVMIVMIALHSLDEYPLWYAYFLLPAAWAWGFTLGSGPTPAPADGHALNGVVGGRPADHQGKLVRLGSDGAGLRWFGVAMVVVSLAATWDYWRVSTIFLDDANLAPLTDRIAAGETSPLFAHHADYAEATTVEPPSRALGALEHATHSLLDTRLMIAWATALAESGQTERARYLVARLKEFRNRDADEFFAPCADDTVATKPFQCQPEPKGLTWRDFR